MNSHSLPDLLLFSSLSFETVFLALFL